MRNIGIIAGVIVVVGALAMSSQYFANSFDGASADVPSDELIPAEVVMTKAQYQDFVAKFAEYYQSTDLPTKNEVITEMRETFYDLVAH